MKVQKKTLICIDFDGVLAQYHGWKGMHHHGKPMPGLKRFLQKLIDADINFVVLTSKDSHKSIKRWFNKYGLPLPLKITSKKIPAAAYVDDRSVYFDGSFSNLLKSLAKFRVHWKRDRPLKNLKRL